MRLAPRILASGAALALLASACGSGTGEGAAATPAKASAAPVAAATVAAPPAPKVLVIVGDTIRGKLGLNDTEVLLEGPGIHCTEQSRFPQGGRIVWRMKALDPFTGKYLDDKQIASFTITYPDGKTDKFAYGGHGGTKENPADMLWAVGFTVPDAYPTGLFTVKIEAKSNDGAVGVWEPFKVSFAQTTIVAKGKDYPETHKG